MFNERLVMPVAVGAIAGYLLGKNTTGAVIGGVIGYLWRQQKNQRNIHEARMIVQSGTQEQQGPGYQTSVVPMDSGAYAE